MHQNARAPYTRIAIATTHQPHRDLLIALLSDAGYEAFEETDDALAAYILASDYDEAAARSILQNIDAGLHHETATIAPQNWNAQWEASFEPVVVPGVCAVRAHFHAPQPGAAHEVVITPRMAFGTGHHATTFLMMQGMAGLDFSGKTVLDFGCGTGVLAILAGKMGAAQITALEIDPGAADNARENAAENGFAAIGIHAGGLEMLPPDSAFDAILANINLHVLLGDMARMAALLLPGGELLLSGVRTEDEPALGQSAEAHGLRHLSTTERDGWLALLFSQGSPVRP